MKALKIIGWILGGLIALVLIAITVATTYLKPERLTPLVENLANDNLRADVKVERVEISFWSTFPRFDIDVTGLEVRTRAFDSLPDSVRNRLAAGADSLLSLRHFNGSLSIPRLFTGSIHVYDVTLERPRITLVQATPEAWSLDIFPPTQEEEVKKEEPLSLPDISLGTFKITDDLGVHYHSLPDSTDASIRLTTTSLEGGDTPLYRLEIQGLASASVPDMAINRLGIGLGGDLKWRPEKPLHIALDEFKVRAGDVTLALDSEMDFAEAFRVDAFEAQLPATPLRDIIALVPADMRGELDKVNAQLTLEAGVKLTQPFTVGVDSLPSFTFNALIPDGTVEYDGFQAKELRLNADGTVDGNNLDNSIIKLNELYARGEGMGFSLEATATDILSDPAVEGCFKGGLSVAHLPKKLLSMIPCTVKGKLLADIDFALRKSYLDKENFHRIKVNGDATITDLGANMPELPLHLYSREIQLKLGTQSSATSRNVRIDSLLTASLAIDTICCIVPGMELQSSGFKAGVGVQNTSSTTDTTLITPMGARITADRLMFKASEDSMRVRLRKAQVGASLSRYKGDSKKPRLHLDISTERAFYADRINFASLTNAFMGVTIHPSALQPGGRRQARLDSLRRVYPNLPQDSLVALLGKNRRKAKTDSTEVLDLELDGSVKKMLRQWDARGRLRADKMRFFSPLFPLRCRVNELDLKFNSDSLTLTDTRVRVGRSDFVLDGTVGNITRALTSSSVNRPLTFNFALRSDTLDINQIAEAVFAGAAFAEKDDGLITIGSAATDTESEAQQEALAQSIAEDSTMAVLVIPSNIEGTCRVSASNIIYSNLTFRDFKGVIDAYRGALNLSELSAQSDVGSVGLNALYSAPTKHDASFAFGMRVKDFNIGEFLKLIPAIDTLMPMMQGIRGIINANMAATTQIDSAMNIDIPSLKAALKISGDSLVVVDQETYRKIGKWLLFKDKTHNVIDSMTVEMIVDNSQMRMFPFLFNIDRYKLGVMGNNDLAMNFNYHIAVLKSPIPFKFGINVSGNPDKMKIRLGRAKFNEKNIAHTVSIADTTRINLVQEISNVFRRGVKNAKVKQLQFNGVTNAIENDLNAADTISHADSLYFMQQGLIPMPDTTKVAPDRPVGKQKRKK